MKKLNLNVAVLLLLSCAGTTFSMEKSLTEEQQKKVKLLENYKSHIQKLNEMERKNKEKYANGQIEYENYDFRRLSFISSKKLFLEKYERFTGLDLSAGAFGIETANLKEFVIQSHYVKNNQVNLTLEN